MMRNIIEKISSMSKWYGVCIILIYGLLIAEYMSFINHLYMKNMVEVPKILEIIMQVNYYAMILSSFVVWIILCLLFHLAALLFDGRQRFSKFMFMASYPYIIPAISLFVAIVLLKDVNIENDNNVIEELMYNSRFKMILNIVNYSFIPYYAVVACIIRYMYNMRWLYAVLSVAIPVLSIWGMTELFKLL